MNALARLEPGAALDGFTLGERIHGGTMALIFRASRPDCAFPLVVKVPRLGHGESGASVVSYEVERTMLAKLSSPHVPRFVAAGELERQPYIAMEYIEGRPLSEWEGGAPVPPEEVARLGVAIATAAHGVHLQEAIHLDLKPTNVIVRPNGEAVLLDFGLAHHAQLPDLLAEEFRRPIGTAPYISPEQVLGVRCDPRSDLFAIGVILYELATGRLPYGAPDSPRKMRARIYRDPVPPRKLVPALPEWLQEVILRCLEPDARRRYASAAQLAFDLDHPDQVAITDRGRRMRPAGWRTRFTRWVRAAGFEPAPCPPPSTQVATAPIILVAVYPRRDNEARDRVLAETVRRAVRSGGECRVVCATVVKPLPEWGTSNPDETSARQHLRHLVELRQWAASLELPQERLTFHVLESGDPSAALLEYARANNVDQIIVGAPSLMDMGRTRRPWGGSVPSRVAAEAPCSVIVVRARDFGERST